MARPPLPIGSWGSINTKNLGRGSWRAFARVRDLDGVTRKASATGPTKAGAENALKADLLKRCRPAGGSLVSPDMLLPDLADVWMARKRAGGAVEDTTLDRYETIIDTVIKKRCKGVRVREANVPLVDALVMGVHAESKANAHTVKTVLGGMLGLAAKQGAITANPVRSLDAMSRAKRNVAALHVDDLEAVRAAVRTWQTAPRPGPKDHDLAHIVDMLLATGLRIGEVLALRWCDIDFEAGTATAAGTLVQVKGQGLLRSPRPKTDASYRELRLPRFALDVLAERAEALDEDHDEESPVFATRRGTWKSPHNVRRQWRAVRKGTGYEWVKPHTFRKTVATLLTEQQDTKAAKEQLGHTSERITEAHYIELPKLGPDVAHILDMLAPQGEPGEHDETI